MEKSKEKIDWPEVFVDEYRMHVRGLYRLGRIKTGLVVQSILATNCLVQKQQVHCLFGMNR